MHLRIGPTCSGLTLCALLACSSEQGADSADCKRYKAVLLKHAWCDPEFAPPPVDDSYDAYRCKSAEEWSEDEGAASLAACADQLEQRVTGTACEVPVLSEERLACKGAIRYVDTDARLSAADVGESCEVDVSPPQDVEFLQLPARSCASNACLLRAGDAPEQAYCTCRCDSAGLDLPTCACPTGFACAKDLLELGRGPNFGGGYCVRE